MKFGYLQTKAYLSDISVFLYLAVLLLTGRKEKIAGILNMTKIRKTRGILDEPMTPTTTFQLEPRHLPLPKV